jgi:hypothetical protein
LGSANAVWLSREINENMTKTSVRFEFNTYS